MDSAPAPFLDLVQKIFFEKIMAWRHGPVVQELYNEFKKHKDSPIPFSQDFNAVIMSLPTTVV